MTTDKTPTDDEIVALADATRTAEGGANGYILPVSFASAVLAKWGSPVVAREQTPCAECDGTGMVSGSQAHFLCPECTTPQPTQAQAGAVPLTPEQMAAGREAIFSTNNPYCPCDSKTFRKVAEWVERHHGIKGGQHGTE